MGATGQPYSDAAYEYAAEGWDSRDQVLVRAALDAAHDRSALGEDASVNIRDCRQEVIHEVATWMKSTAVNNTDGHVLRWAADEISREFGSTV